MKAFIASLLIGVAGSTGALHHDPAAAPPVVAWPAPADRPPPSRPPAPPRPIPRVLCESPPTLRLIRFEDGSARLECGQRILLRVAVPW